MDDVIKFIIDNWKFIAIIIAGVFLIIFTVFSIVVSKLVSRRIEKARKTTLTKCPHCGELFTLSDVDFLLPTGEEDNNLNGVPDDKERRKP